MRASTAWNVLDRAGVPGITDVWCPPVQTGINLLIRMKSSYRNQAKQAANAIWGSSAAHVRYKHITVVDDDIDIHDYAAVDWAIAHRVNAGEDDIIIMPSTFGAGLDPSTRKRDRNPALFGTGKWNRVLIDATMNLDYDPDPELGGARFPPKVWPEQNDIDATMKRWQEFGLDKPKNGCAPDALSLPVFGEVSSSARTDRENALSALLRSLHHIPGAVDDIFRNSEHVAERCIDFLPIHGIDHQLLLLGVGLEFG
jgi:hypothetical protein